MPVTMAGRATVNEDQPRALATYLDLVRPMFSRRKIKVLNRFRIEREADGMDAAEIVVILECPDLDTIYALFESSEYRKAIPYRDLAFSAYDVQPVT